MGVKLCAGRRCLLGGAVCWAALFAGRRCLLVLTNTGQMVLRYADEIFSLGRELADTRQGRPVKDSIRLLVEVPDVSPQLVVSRLLEPALELEQRVKLICHARE